MTRAAPFFPGSRVSTYGMTSKGGLMTPGPVSRLAGGFTLLEVMIALGVLAIAMLALLSLHHQDIQSIIRARELSEAAMLAQGVMTDAELQGFPPLGKTSGNFQKIYPGQYRNFRWTRVVSQSPMFPDVRQVEVTIQYGAGFHKNFTVVEFLHYPEPQTAPPGTAANQLPLGMQGRALGQQ